MTVLVVKKVLYKYPYSKAKIIKEVKTKEEGLNYIKKFGEVGYHYYIEEVEKL